MSEIWIFYNFSVTVRNFRLYSERIFALFTIKFLPIICLPIMQDVETSGDSKFIQIAIWIVHNRDIKI